MNKTFVLTTTIIILILATSDLQAQGSNTIVDKDLHILAGTIVTLGTAGVIFFASSDDPTIMGTAAIAGAAAILAGIGKELFDILGSGTPEFRDIFNTILGGAVGIAGIAFSLTAFPMEALNGSELKYTFLTISAVLSLPVLHYIFGTGYEREKADR